MKVVGIDEAGKGPVIGDLVIAGVMINEDQEHLLEGAKDSKLLTQKKRLELEETEILGTILVTATKAIHKRDVS